MNKAEIFKLFLKDVQQPAIQMALHRSFRLYADRRDQLIDIYTAKTGIPAEEFHSQIARENAGFLA